MIRLCSSPSMLSSLAGLFLGELVDGDAGPDAEHLGDVLSRRTSSNRSTPLAFDLASLWSTSSSSSDFSGRGVGLPLEALLLDGTLLDSCTSLSLLLELLEVGRPCPSA